MFSSELQSLIAHQAYPHVGSHANILEWQDKLFEARDIGQGLDLMELSTLQGTWFLDGFLKHFGITESYVSKSEGDCMQSANQETLRMLDYATVLEYNDPESAIRMLRYMILIVKNISKNLSGCGFKVDIDRVNELYEKSVGPMMHILFIKNTSQMADVLINGSNVSSPTKKWIDEYKRGEYLKAGRYFGQAIQEYEDGYRRWTNEQQAKFAVAKYNQGITSVDDVVGRKFSQDQVQKFAKGLFYGDS